MKNVTPALLLSVACPICDAAVGNACVFGSGVPRSEPHLDRKMLAADDIEERSFQRTKVKSISSRLMKLFETLGEDRLELHVLFGVAGNGNNEKLKVMDAIDNLVRAGMLEASGDEFYALTEKSKVPVAQLG